MGNLRKLRRNLDEGQVYLASRRKEILKDIVVKKAKENKEFAQELLDRFGDNLLPDVKEAVEKTLEPVIEEAGKESLPIDPLIEENV